MGVLLCLYPSLFAHFIKTGPLKSKIKEMTSKLDNKAGASWSVSGYDFFFYICAIDMVEQDGEGNGSTLLRV